MNTTTETSWASTRTKYSAIFGAPPQPIDDNDIGTVFRTHGLDILAELERIAHDYTAGKIRSPWRLLAKKLDRIVGDHDHIDITREIRVKQAEAWIYNAGCHVDRPEEILDELFHATGALLPGLEHILGDQMVALWRNERPRGEKAAADAIARGQRFQRDRAKLHAIPAALLVAETEAAA